MSETTGLGPDRPDATAAKDPPAAGVRWGAVGVFGLIAFGLAWLIDLPLWLSGRGLATPGAGILITLSMFAPLVAAFVTVLAVERTGPRTLVRRLGWWPLRPVGRTVGLAVAGLVGGMLLPIATVLAAAAMGLMELDLVHFSGAAASIASQLPPGAELPIPIEQIAIAQFATLPVAAVMNSLFTLGEETGWRGYLLPALRPLGTWPALLISGAVWGLWHAPVILLGYNFARPNALGLGLMVVGCVFLGVLFGWLRIRSATIWPAVLAHGAFNAAAGVATLVAAAGTETDQAVVGPLGWVAWIVMAIVALGLVLARAFPRKDAWPVAR